MVRQTKILLIRSGNPVLALLAGAILLVLTMLFPGCGQKLITNDIPSDSIVKALMLARNIDVIYSDSGRMEARITGPLVYRYSGEKPWMEFPEGFRAEMFDSAGRMETSITADYGKRVEVSRIMEARGNVIVRNEFKQEQLNTEVLTWNEMRHIIHTDAPVKITTPDKVLYGTGLEANETFSVYKILRPRGEMLVADSAK